MVPGLHRGGGAPAAGVDGLRRRTRRWAGVEWERAQLSVQALRGLAETDLDHPAKAKGGTRVCLGRSGVLRARSGIGVRVYGRMGGCSLDVGSGD